jgi:hypothetical protein
MTKHIKLKVDTMRNLGLVFFFIASGLFLQGCDSTAHYSISIKSKEPPSAEMDNKKLEIIKVVEPILRQHGFVPSPGYVEGVSLIMEKNPSDRHGKIYIGLSCENNIIQIGTVEWGTQRMSDFALNLQNEIIDKLDQPLKDCCIIIKYDKYSGRK